MEGFFLVLLLAVLMIILFCLVIKFGRSNLLRWATLVVMALIIPLGFFATQVPRGTDLRIENSAFLRPDLLREVQILNARRVSNRIFLYVLPPGGLPVLVSIPYSEEAEQEYLSARNQAIRAEADGREAEIMINFGEYGDSGRAPVSVREFVKNRQQR
jgi:hypothetical protein